MSLKVRAILVVVIGTVMGLSLSIGGGLLANGPAPAEAELAWENARLFAEVMERVKQDYVEPLDDSQLLESAIRGMVSDLDAHSQYLDADDRDEILVMLDCHPIGGSYPERLVRVCLLGDAISSTATLLHCINLLDLFDYGERGLECPDIPGPRLDPRPLDGEFKRPAAAVFGLLAVIPLLHRPQVADHPRVDLRFAVAA